MQQSQVEGRLKDCCVPSRVDVTGWRHEVDGADVRVLGLEPQEADELRGQSRGVCWLALVTSKVVLVGTRLLQQPLQLCSKKSCDHIQ